MDDKLFIIKVNPSYAEQIAKTIEKRFYCPVKTILVEKETASELYVDNVTNIIPSQGIIFRIRSYAEGMQEAFYQRDMANLPK